VTTFRTLRLKKPTVDLLFTNGLLCTRSGPNLIAMAHGHPKMVDNSIYEMSVVRSRDGAGVAFSNPVRRLVKTSPNGPDIIRRAIMSVFDDVEMSTVLYDITCMSFRMRSKVYEMAQASASVSRKVIVIFGAGRFQEMNEMNNEEFSYIAIDPELDISLLSKRMKKMRITPYDMGTAFSKQVSAITNRPRNLLYYRGRSEDFISMTNAVSDMCTMGIPAVFPFSVSYHIRVINTLTYSGVKAFGCGYVHDKMPTSGVQSPPVHMNLVKKEFSLPMVESKFGKSTWLEPILLTNSVTNLRLVRDSMPDVWAMVDESTYEIMSRAVIMC